MQGRRLAVLMWKHLTVRKRRFIHTPIEILSPIVFFVILFCLKDKINPVRSSSSKHGQEIRNTDILRLSDLSSPRLVLFTPDTPLTNELMDEVGKRLIGIKNRKGLQRLKNVPNRLDHEIGYCPFSNFSEISEIISEMYDTDAVITFDNMKDRDSLPDRLSYTIRLRGTFVTNTYEPQDGRATTPHSQYGMIYDKFLNIQWAIDTSFIKMLTGNDVTQNLTLQEFPSVTRSNSDIMSAICSGIIIICWLSLFLVFVFLMSRLLEERSTGIQELIKMVGVSTNLFGISHFLNTVPAGIVFCVGGTALLKAGSNAVLPNSNGFLIFLMLALQFVSVVAMAFACSYFTKHTQYTVSLSVLAYVALWMSASIVRARNVSGLMLLTGLLPHVPLQWFFMEVAAREQYDEGLSISDVMTAHSATSGPVFLAMVFLLLQVAYFFLLSWYLSLVRPGNFGTALPWNFFIQKQYWSKNEVLPESDADEEIPIAREAKYFEEPPKDLETGIKIENVSKVFPKHVALNNVSLDVYKGEITVLLGHNGAGKTTLMSIITGMMSASEGRVLVNGLDTRRAGSAVRSQLGLCPQHNLFFPDLTVLEHAMFFAMLKGGSFKNARAESLNLLQKLGLREKAHVLSATLSGGMKRRLQLACALSGGASVLVLDEPTSGLDVETRRELWDLLLSLRGERTVLLTTHFMEEADALGDRVAALHLGRLRCHATTMHLKKAVGTGYRLTFTTNGPPRDAAVTDAVTSKVPDATLKEKTMNSLSYNLPAASSFHFPQLFSSLEERRSELGIETIGVGVSTLEEVFLKLCSDTDTTTFSDDEMDAGRTEPTYNKVTGPMLYCRQFILLLKRQFKYVMHKRSAFLALQVIIPMIILCVFTKTCNNSQSSVQTNDRVALDLDIYAPMPQKKVLFDINATGISMRALNDLYPKVDFVEAKNVSDVILRISEKDVTEFGKYLVGIEINDTDVKVLYTTSVRHAAPVALSVLSNALASRDRPQAGGRSLAAHIQPVDVDRPIQLDETLVQPKTLDLAIMWSVLVVFVILSSNINSVSLPVKERVSGTRHIHLMSGCPAALHWAATCAFHLAVCFIFLVVTVAVAAATLDSDHTIDKPDVIFSLILVLTLGALAFFSFMYLVSFFFEERGASILLIAALVIFGLITTSLQTATSIFKQSDTTSVSEVLLSIVGYTMPPHAATLAVAKCVNVARINAYCHLNRGRCPMLHVFEAGFDTAKCCAGENPRCFMCIDDYSPGQEMIVLSLQFLVYMTLVILVQRGTLNYVHDRIFNGRYRNSAPKVESSDDIVRAEAVYVNKQILLPKQKIIESNQAMLASDLHKNYYRIFGKSCNAVKGVSFSVKKGECFGLLGVNGAGKSTTFKMLTAEECPTKGDIYANGHFLGERGAYLRSLGYCPQFFGLDEFQTGRENLTLLLTLRGLSYEDLENEVKSWIEVVGLQKYSDRLVSGYSGGCTRRLAAAASLSTGAPVALLDEPTCGVDVSARRRVWRALARGLRQGRAVLITSHSMDEMEALCSRIAILSRGAVRAVGTPSELRARHAAGHAVVIKVARPAHADEVDGGKSDLERLKSSLHHKFNCTLKDEHKTMLHYHINETLRYSNLFNALEELKTTYPALVEDYSVTETTLEEVFLSFAKEQHETATQQTRNHVV